MSTAGDLGAYVSRAAAAGELVVQPRMGMPDPSAMAAGLRAVAGADATTAGTITLDSYTRVGDHKSARSALLDGGDLNGYPIVVHGPEVTARVIAPISPLPVQVRHGSAGPQAIFATMAAAGLSASEGGPVSYCLPYGRTPLAESVARWRDATQQLAHDCAVNGRRAHLETFGGCLLGQLCPPSLLIAVSLLEGLFFVQHGVRSISFSYAQQTHPGQDVEALTALRLLAGELFGADVDWHVVLYTYMGVYPATESGAGLLLDRSAEIAVRGGAQRLIVKTTAEAHRLPTVDENVQALERAAAVARGVPPGTGVTTAVDCAEVLAEVRALVDAVLGLSDDLGRALLAAFGQGLLDVPFCLHRDNRGLTQGAIGADGRLCWARTGRLPLPAAARVKAHASVTSSGLLRMLRHTADEHDRLALTRT